MAKLERADARTGKRKNSVRLNGNRIEIPGFNPDVFAETLARRKAAPQTLAQKKARVDRLAREHGL